MILSLMTVIGCHKEDTPCPVLTYDMWSNYSSAYNYCRWNGPYDPTLVYMWTKTSDNCLYYSGLDTIIHYQSNCPKYGVITITNRIIVQ